MLIQRAMARESEGDIESAVRLYAEALENDPKLASAHLDLALLYHDRLKDYVLAVYHYSRYLESRPTTEKREMILNRMRLAKQALAASLLKPERFSSDRVLTLEKDNELLQRQVAELKQQLERAESRIQILQRRPVPAGSNGGGSGAGGGTPVARTYKVKRGDSLSTIAASVYGDGLQWRRIAEANKDTLRGSDKVREGQILIIP